MSVIVYNWRNRPPGVGLDCGSESRTAQEFKDDCDINRIMKRYASQGVLPSVAGAKFGDFSKVEDYFQAQNLLLAAKAQFDGLPSGVRDRFANDPSLFLAFMNDDKNKDEARKLGLLKEVVPPPAPVKVEVTNAPVVPPVVPVPVPASGK